MSQGYGEGERESGKESGLCFARKGSILREGFNGGSEGRPSTLTHIPRLSA